jgi:hypothetical protein
MFDTRDLTGKREKRDKNDVDFSYPLIAPPLAISHRYSEATEP